MSLFDDARACTLCVQHLPLGPRPVFRGLPSARLLIVGQAPGTRVHESGIPWNDRSGEVLRGWLGMERDGFYDEARIAILPMGLCYPGRAANGGDLPPRPECAPTWHPVLRPLFPNIRLTLLVGLYAQAYYLAERRKRTLTDTVAAWRDYGPKVLPLPHPSWRTIAWQRKNPWFADELLPELRQRLTSVWSDNAPEC